VSAELHGATLKDLNPLNAELNLICHLLALLGAHHILHVSGIRVNLNAEYLEQFHTHSFGQHLHRQNHIIPSELPAPL